MDAEKNTTNTEETNANAEAASFKTKREQWEAEWKAEFKRDWEKNWKKEWKSEWKREWKHHDRPNLIKVELGNGQTYSISLGKLIFGAFLLMILPFKFVLVIGALYAAYHFGRRSANEDSNENKPKQNRDEVTAA